jgi:predicted acyl esterase
MKKILLSAIIVLIVVAQGWAGTFTTQNTLIPVPAEATGTAAGDTSPNSATNIHLDARVYIPDGVGAPAPVLVIIHGYGGSKDDSRVIALATDFATNGYVVLTPTARGFGQSDGLVTLAGPNEVNDLKTIILAMQTGAIGDSPAVTIPVTGSSAFGVTGASYGGGHSFEIVRTHVAGLLAVAPIIGWTDLYQALSPNDVPKFSFVIGLFASGFDTAHPNYDNQMFDWLGSFLGGDPESLRTGAPLNNVDWRSVIFNPTELTVPMFVIQGWRDWLFPAEQATSLFEATTAIPFFKLYIAGLGHPPATADINSPEALFLRQQLLRWFDHWLKGVDNGINTEPRVTVAPEKTANWSQAALVTADTFPLPGTTMTTYFINKGTLSTTGPGGKKAIKVNPTTGVPTFLQPIEHALGNSTALIGAVMAVNGLLNQSGDILDANVVTNLDTGASFQTFTSAALTQDLHVVGLPQFQFFVSGGAADAYYHVQIVERLAGGSERLITRGAFKDHAANPSASHEIDFSAFAINHVFKTGSRIRLHIASRDFPFFLPNLDQPTVKIFRDAQRPSSLTLPVVP